MAASRIHAVDEYNAIVEDMESSFGYGARRIPQLHEVGPTHPLPQSPCRRTASIHPPPHRLPALELLLSKPPPE